MLHHWFVLLLSVLATGAQAGPAPARRLILLEGPHVMVVLMTERLSSCEDSTSAYRVTLGTFPRDTRLHVRF
jgi:hypothetical protein